MIQLLRKKGRLLVLDDDVAMQKLVSTLLRREGYRVDLVGDGRAAIEKMQKDDYDAILLDLMMPVEGGMTVIKHLRDTKPETLRKVIVLTASPQSVLKGIRTEVFAVVQKPFEREELINAVRAVLGA